MKKARLARFTVATVVAVGLLASPAAAHNMTVDPPGDHGNDTEHWIGGPLLPEQAEGEGLFPGPPFAPERKQSAAHGKGLVEACEATESNDVVTILGPGPTPCIHG